MEQSLNNNFTSRINPSRMSICLTVYFKRVIISLNIYVKSFLLELLCVLKTEIHRIFLILLG